MFITRKKSNVGVSFKKYFLLLMVGLLMAAGVDAKYYIATKELKVHATKGKKAKVIGVVKIRSTVDVTEIDDIWWRITYNDQDGYVQGKFLKEAPENISVTEQTTVDETSKLPFGISTISLVIIIGSILAVIVTIRQIRNYIARKKARLAYRPPAEKIARITHWYQCKHCSAAIKKDTEPSIAGCSQSLRHLWINLGPLGNLKYICKNCSTIIMVAEEPRKDGCPNNDEHQWKKL